MSYDEKVRDNTPIAVLTATLTRPNDTTAYAAGDVVATATSAGAGFVFTIPTDDIPTGRLIYGGALQVNAAVAMSGVIYLSTVTAGALADNAAYNATAAAMGARVGALNLGSTVTSTAPSSWNELTTNKTIPIPAGTSALYGVFVPSAAFTPVASTVFSLNLHMV